MTLSKSQWSANGDQLNLTMDFSKVDAENRLVYGFATLDNYDEQGDRILPEANMKAFGKSRGNLREMHDNIAAGKVVDFGEQDYLAEDGKVYKGVYVKAYVSKGAQSTWEKVLDGTLTGFSIGGKLVDSESAFDKAAGKTIRIIKDYDLVELSLVDNPANQMANIVSVVKNESGADFLKGIAIDTNVQNVMYCNEHEIARATTEKTADCGACGNEMQNIGWFEDTADRETELGKVVSNYLSSKRSEGGVTNMTDTITKSDEVSEDGKDSTDVVHAPDVDEQGKEVEQKDDDLTAGVVTSDDTNTDEDSVKKMVSDLETSLTEAISKSSDVAAELVKTVEARLSEIQKSSDDRFSEIDSKYDELSKSLKAGKDASDTVAKRLEALEGSTAIKKSNDVEKVVEATETDESDSVWKGAFLPKGSLIS